MVKKIVKTGNALSDKNSLDQGILAEKAGYILTALSATFVLAIIGVLAWHIHLIQEPNITWMDGFKPAINCSTTECIQQNSMLKLELKLVSDRTERIRVALSSRVMISVVAEVVALTLVVLGGSLIFNRIQSDKEAVLVKGGATSNQWSFFLGTAFPGVLLCLFGSFILLGAMYFPSKMSARISVRDIPVFIPDDNFNRNYIFKQFAGTNLNIKRGSKTTSENKELLEVLPMAEK